MNSYPTSMMTLLATILDVLAFSQNGMNPRLFHRKCFDHRWFGGVAEKTDLANRTAKRQMKNFFMNKDGCRMGAESKTKTTKH